MITQETAALIWNARREVITALKLLEDMKKTRQFESDKHAPTLLDHFGRKQHLQLGIPSGENGHRLFEVSPLLAESVIRAHIENSKKRLVEANERARIELDMETEENLPGVNNG